jgi:hypothetical protein
MRESAATIADAEWPEGNEPDLRRGPITWTSSNNETGLKVGKLSLIKFTTNPLKISNITAYKKALLSTVSSRPARTASMYPFPRVVKNNHNGSE